MIVELRLTPDDFVRLSRRLRDLRDAPLRQDAGSTWDADDWSRHHAVALEVIEDVLEALGDVLSEGHLESEREAGWRKGWSDGFEEGKYLGQALARRSAFAEGYETCINQLKGAGK